ncbi:MAG: glycerophosphoryl diester phosphodiesterase [Candidatus Marinamargulisbacteria bacterium]|jgi:glycerophosphoryl diester phosphodiesterase
MTLEDLQKLDAGSHFFPKFKGEKIPRLEQVLRLPGPTVPLIIEVKVESSGEEMISIVNQLIVLIDRYKPEDSVVISAFNPYVLKAFKERSPTIFRALLYSDFNTEPNLSPLTKFILKHRLIRRLADPIILMPQERIVRKRNVKVQQKKGYKIIPWTVNEDTATQKFITMGVDGLITDRPSYTRRLL